MRREGRDTRFIYDQTGIPLPKAQSEQIMQATRSVGEALSLIDEIQKHPERVGRSGQVRGFIDRYMVSVLDAFRNNLPIPSPQIQAGEERLTEEQQQALLFAKRYAAYLVNYERSLAGGARGFTVSFQQRFNRLMAQEQFSAPGLIGLLRDQVEEVTQGAATPGIPQLNRNGIVRLAIDSFDQSVSANRRGTAESGYRVAFPNDPLPARTPRASSAQVPTETQTAPPPPPPSGTVQPSQNAIEFLRANPSQERRDQFDEVYGAGAASRILGGR